MVTAESRLVALLGLPVANSLSPRMQNAAFAARALDWVYVACAVEGSELAAALHGLAALGFAGANVTAPHKGAAAQLCDELDEPARAAGSVNTLVVRDGRLLGSSTDAEVLRDVPDGELARACLIGNGGAAKAFAAALAARGSAVDVFERRGDWPPRADGAGLIVQATPVRDELLVEPQPGQTVIELPYRADGGPTALAAEARRRGCRVLDGLDVLVAQGAASFERWTGVTAPREVMRRAITLRA